MSHENPKTTRDEYLTPLWVINELGPFDLDPCASIKRPWDTAKNHYTYLDNGLLLPWRGRVWCNPPYGLNKEFLRRCVSHDNCMVLIPARTETEYFYEYVWKRADGLLFMRNRIHFCNTDGSSVGRSSFASVFIAYGVENAIKLRDSDINGQYIDMIYERTKNT